MRTDKMHRPATAKLVTVAWVPLVALLVSSVPSICSEVLPSPWLPLLDQPASRVDTFWIFDAGFEDLQGHNIGIQDLGEFGDRYTGWFTYDFSPHPPLEPQWHVDTFRAYQDGSPPDLSFWCGRHDPCWIMSGYGDEWRQLLWRDFDLTSTPPGTGELVFRQRVGLETGYDYGYVDIASIDGDSLSSFQTVYSVSNVPFGSTPGAQINWDYWDAELAHPNIDISEWLGRSIRVRWRLESDAILSSERPGHCTPHASFTDGGWFIDEVEILADGAAIFHADFDDPAEPSNQGWIAADGADEQVGVVWQRVASDSLDPGIPGTPEGDWLLSAFDSATGFMAEHQRAYLVTPVFGIAGIPDFEDMVLELRGYFEFPPEPYYYLSLAAATGDSLGCLGERSTFCEWLYPPNVTETGWYTLAIPLEPTNFGAMLSGTHMRLRLSQHTWDLPTPSRGLLLDRLRVGTTADIGTGIQDADGMSPSGLRLDLASPFVPSGRLCTLRGISGHVTVSVFDLRGRLIRRLLDIQVAALADIDVDWDGTDSAGQHIARGVYFVKAEAEGSSSAAKTVVLR